MKNFKRIISIMIIVFLICLEITSIIKSDVNNVILNESTTNPLSNASDKKIESTSVEIDLYEEKIDEFAEIVMREKTESLGYPGNQYVKLANFYKWIVKPGLDFEREVIEFLICKRCKIYF